MKDASLFLFFACSLLSLFAIKSDDMKKQINFQMISLFHLFFKTLCVREVLRDFTQRMKKKKSK